MKPSPPAPLSVYLCVCFQALQPEPGCSAVVLCQVSLLWAVGLSDSLWLSDTSSGELFDQELQLPQPLPVPGVSAAPLV